MAKPNKQYEINGGNLPPRRERVLFVIPVIRLLPYLALETSVLLVIDYRNRNISILRYDTNTKKYVRVLHKLNHAKPSVYAATNK